MRVPNKVHKEKERYPNRLQCFTFTLLPLVFLSLFTLTESAFFRPVIHKSSMYGNTVQPRRTRKASFRIRPRSERGPLYSRPQDNLVSGISEIGIGFSLGVLWSEYSIILTGCGPLNFSDTLERVCYQGVIALAGLSLFNRIVTGKSLEYSSIYIFGELENFTLVQVKAAEYASSLAVLGAFLALAFQYSRGENMDGLSGIDVGMCRALRDL
jgi:hypothetical protein